MLKVGDIVLDRETHRVTRTIARQHLGRDDHVDERTVDVYVARLRKAVNDGVQNVIRTICGTGYALRKG